MDDQGAQKRDAQRKIWLKAQRSRDSAFFVQRFISRTWQWIRHGE